MTLYTIHNPHPATRVIYPEATSRELRVRPGETIRSVYISSQIMPSLRRSCDLDMLIERNAPVVDMPLEAQDALPIAVDKPAMVVDGMYGIGDNLHQRAVLRELMRDFDVYLISCHFTLYWDLVRQGLKVIFKPTRLRAQAKTIERERQLFHKITVPLNGVRKKIWYNKVDIDKHGSILMSMFGEFGLRPEKPDFSLPLMPEWRAAARGLIESWKPGKPLMVLRPIVRRREWDGDSRNPDPHAFDAIYRSIRERFFVVSVADLAPGLEWIVGDEQDADVKLHQGELDFGTMAALWAEASMVLTPAGFGPVLAQAVGTPSITVYGGRESSRTTQAAGAHLAPTCSIDTVKPCDCHSHRHRCEKRIDVPKALERVNEFVNQNLKAKGDVAQAASAAEQPAPQAPEPREHRDAKKILVFATVYVDSEARRKLTDHWLTLHQHLNGDACDFLIVDSQSPVKPFIHDAKHGIFEVYKSGKPAHRMLHEFPDNIGHLSRRGRDGWGRAFCFGLQAAIDCAYDYVVHIEGDSLFRRKVRPIVEHMEARHIRVASTPVEGMHRAMQGWVETGLIFFEVRHLKDSNFIGKYNWPARREYPTPEVVVRSLIGTYLHLMPWRAMRGDKAQITHDNVLAWNLDWITHCHRDIWCYDKFIEAAMGKEPQPTASAPVAEGRPQSATPISAPLTGLQLNFGCGTNKLPSPWRNMDAEVDITQRLPFADASATYIFAEHVVEHVPWQKAVGFFEECHRVLVPGGVLRIAVPSVEQIMNCGDVSYYRFTQKWQKLGATPRGAMHAILYAHGHEMPWTASLLDCLLFYAGFDDRKQRRPGESEHEALKHVEGHGKVIGDRFNAIETLIFEGRKGEAPVPAMVAARSKVAIVVGGAKRVMEELATARELVRAAGLTPTYFVVNALIPFIEGEIYAVTLHPNELPGWLDARAAKGYPTPIEIWAHRPWGRATHTTADWSGSSGLFAVKVAHIEKHFDKVVLCGVPMRMDDSHYVRDKPWGACRSFEGGWRTHFSEYSEFTRSFSGLTREMLGEPTMEWLQS